METSEIENLKAPKDIINNFRLRKNIPVDTRFLISSLANLDIEIPLSLRYPGLITFIPDATNPNGAGVLYYFGNDLTTPLILDDGVYTSSVKSLTIVSEDYTNLLADLVDYEIEGNIMYIQPLGIGIIYTSTGWEYFAGIYNVTDQLTYNTIPLSLLQPRKLVLLGGDERIINEDKTLSTKVIVVATLPGTPLEDRYYLYKGFLYITLDGVLHKLTSKIYTNDVVLVYGANEIIHNLESVNINVLFRINEPTNPFIVNNTTKNMPYVSIDEFKIEVISDYNTNINGKLIILTN